MADHAISVTATLDEVVLRQVLGGNSSCLLQPHRYSAMRDTLLIVGNGFALDFRAHSPGMPDPCRPLDYRLVTPGIPDRPLRVTFRELWEQIDALRGADPGTDDFRLIEQIRLLPKPDANVARGMFLDLAARRQHLRNRHARELVEAQLRLHLTHAYCLFTSMIDDAALRSWRWCSWLDANADRLHMAVSFDYDLLLEKAIATVLPVRYLTQGCGIFGVRPEILMFKPHGSVNFEIEENQIFFDIPNDNVCFYGMKHIFSLVN